MLPGCGDANEAISRAKTRDTGSADTGSAEDGGIDTGSADADSAGYNGVGGANGGGEGVSVSAKLVSSPNEADSSPERDAPSSSLSSSLSYQVRHGQATQQAVGYGTGLP
jgi:hypothetical protein